MPVGQLFNALRDLGLEALQEDGTPWSGFLVGGAECGSEKAANQRANFPLAAKQEDGSYRLTKVALILSWCVMPSGKYEIIGYLS